MRTDSTDPRRARLHAALGVAAALALLVAGAWPPAGHDVVPVASARPVAPPVAPASTVTAAPVAPAPTVTAAPVAPAPTVPHVPATTRAAAAPSTTTVAAPARRVGPSNPAVLRASGPITIRRPGAVVEDVDVTGAIVVAADHVTLRNFRANNVEQRGARGMVLEDGEITGAQNPYADGVTWADYTARRLEVRGTADGFKAMGNVLIEGCWVHHLHFFTGDAAGAGGYSHNDGVQVSSGRDITIRDSVFEHNRGNAAVFIDADQGPIDGVTVAANVLGGGGFTLYSIRSRSAPQHGFPTGVVVRDNVFTDEHLFDYAAVAPGTRWYGNTDTAGRPVRARIDTM